MLPSKLLETTWVGHSPGRNENCLVTAMRKGTNSTTWTIELQELLSGILGRVDVTAWNDTPGRTKAEVVAVARLAEMKLGLRPEPAALESEVYV